MDKILNKKFTTSQFAAMHNINKRTLMYYDQIGLFSPEEVRENGYRYYTFRQNFLFSSILLLRKMHISLKDIGRYLKNYTQDNLLELLRSQDRVLEEQIGELLWLQKILRNKINNMEGKEKVIFSSLKMIKEKARAVVLSEAVEEIPAEKMVPLAAGFISDCYKNRVYCGHPMGVVFDARAMQQKNERILKNFFYFLGKQDEKEKNLPCSYKPAGYYLVGYYKGQWEEVPSFYNGLLAHAKDAGLVFGENIYEEKILDDVAARAGNYVELKISAQLV